MPFVCTVELHVTPASNKILSFIFTVPCIVTQY